MEIFSNIFLSFSGWLKLGGILLLTSLIPATFYSFFRYRLPRKEEQYKKFIKYFFPKQHDMAMHIPMIENEYSKLDYLLPVSLATFLCFLGSFTLLLGTEIGLAKIPNLLFLGIHSSEGDFFSYQEKSLVALTLGFMGAYVWSIQYIFRRFVTLDLAPAAYFSITIRMILASLVALMYRHVSETSYVPNFSPGSLPVIAFLIGIFPQRGLHYLMEMFTFIFHKGIKKSDELPLDMIEGINFLHKVRLSEVGIDNAQNLAEANILELYLKTPFNFRLLIDWIGQAKLYVCLKNNFVKLRSSSVRTIFDLMVVGKIDGELSKLDQITGIPASELNSLYQIIEKDHDVIQLFKLKKLIAEA